MAINGGLARRSVVRLMVRGGAVRSGVVAVRRHAASVVRGGGVVVKPGVVVRKWDVVEANPLVVAKVGPVVFGRPPPHKGAEPRTVST